MPTLDQKHGAVFRAIKYYVVTLFPETVFQ